MLSYKTLLIFLMISFVGCGYQFGAKRAFPGGVTKIAIPTFKNKTYEAGIESAFTKALKYEFLKSGYVQLVSEKEAEAVIYGTVSSFQGIVGGTTEKTFPTSTKRKPKLLGTSYSAEAVVDIVVKKKNKKKPLWSYSLSASESYGAGEEYLKNETNQREAIEELSERMMEEIHDRLFLNF